eukprot:scpid104296/ scgid29017/ 
MAVAIITLAFMLLGSCPFEVANSNKYKQINNPPPFASYHFPTTSNCVLYRTGQVTEPSCFNAASLIFTNFQYTFLRRSVNAWTTNVSMQEGGNPVFTLAK